MLTPCPSCWLCIVSLQQHLQVPSKCHLEICPMFLVFNDDLFGNAPCKDSITLKINFLGMSMSAEFQIVIQQRFAVNYKLYSVLQGFLHSCSSTGKELCIKQQ